MVVGTTAAGTAEERRTIGWEIIRWIWARTARGLKLFARKEGFHENDETTAWETTKRKSWITDNHVPSSPVSGVLWVHNEDSQERLNESMKWNPPVRNEFWVLQSVKCTMNIYIYLGVGGWVKPKLNIQMKVLEPKWEAIIKWRSHVKHNEQVR